MMRKYLKKFQKIVAIALVLSTGLLFSPGLAEAANTHSATFVQASSQYASLASNIGITGGNITMEAWFNTGTLPPAATRTIAATADSGTFVLYTLEFGDGGSGNTTFSFKRGRQFVADNRATWTTNTLSTNTWYHLVGTYDGTNVRLYYAPQNGTHTLVGGPTASSGDGMTLQSSFVAIATSLNPTVPGEFGSGLVDDLRFWNTVRTTTEMDDNFQTEMVGNESGLRAYYKLNNDFTDETANNYDLTAVNSPTFTTNVAFTGVVAATPIRQEDFIFFE